MEGMRRGRFFDRWGGGFILVTVLGVALAWAIGASLLDRKAPVSPAGETAAGAAGAGATAAAPGQTAEPVEPVLAAKAYTLYVVQTGLFNQKQGADKTVQGLQSKGFPAAVSRSAPYRIFAGAYSSEGAARSATASVRKGGFSDAFVAKLDIVPPAGMPASDADQFQQTVTALTGYLADVAQWWDSYAAGKPGTTDRIASEAKAAEAAGGKLQSVAGQDAAIADLVGLTSRAAENGQELAALGKAARPEAARVAMQHYLDLLRDYHDWAESRQ